MTHTQHDTQTCSHAGECYSVNMCDCTCARCTVSTERRLYAANVTTSCDVTPAHTHTSSYLVSDLAQLARLAERSDVLSIVCDHDAEYFEPACKLIDCTLIDYTQSAS